MISFTLDTKRPVCWTSVTSCFVLLAALCYCNGVQHQKTVTMADPLQSASESSTMPDTTKQQAPSPIDLGALLDARDGAIVTLVAGDTRLAAHRAVLATSHVLAALFSPDTLEASSSEVSIPGVEGPVLRQLVAFLYTGRAPQLTGMAPKLLAAAHKYGVSALRDASEQQVLKHLDMESAADAAVVAVRYSLHSLRKDAIAFIKAHVFEVMTTQGWAEAVINHPREVLQITRLLAEPLEETSTTTKAESTHTDSAATTATPAASDNMSTPTATPAAADNMSTPTATDLTTPRTYLSTTPPDAAAVTYLLATAAADNMPTATTVPVTTIATPADAENTSTTTVTAPTTPMGCICPTPPDAAAVSSLPATTTADSTPTATAAFATIIATSATAANASTPTVTATTSSVGCLWPPLPNASKIAYLRSKSNWEKTWRLNRAAEEGLVHEVRALLAAGTDVRAKDSFKPGFTALHWAARNGRVQMASCLLQVGAELDARENEYRKTPLHCAAQHGRTEVVRLLLAASADINATNKNGLTPLHYVAYWGHAEPAAVLLQAGADRRARNNAGRTPLDQAREYKNPQLVQMLQ